MQTTVGFSLFLSVDGGQKPAAPREAGAGGAEAAADHPQGGDSAGGGGGACSEGGGPHKGTSTCLVKEPLLFQVGLY